MTDITITQSYDDWIEVLEAMEAGYDAALELADQSSDDGQEWEMRVHRGSATIIALRYGAIAAALPAGPKGHRISAHIQEAALDFLNRRSS